MIVTINLPVMVPCPQCNGTGLLGQGTTAPYRCYGCGGKGMVKQ